MICRSKVTIISPWVNNVHPACLRTLSNPGYKPLEESHSALGLDQGQWTLLKTVCLLHKTHSLSSLYRCLCISLYFSGQWETLLAQAFAKCLHHPFLLSKQVILFSIPVSCGNGYHLPTKKVTHTHTHTPAQRWKTLPEKLLRLIWQWKLQVTFYNKHRTTSRSCSGRVFLHFTIFVFLWKL